MRGVSTYLFFQNYLSFVKIFSLRKIIFYVASISLITIAYLKWGEVHELREIFSRSNISWLLMAVFLQVLTYIFLALNYHYIFKIKGHMVSYLKLYPMAFIVQFINQVFPSAGISGQIFFVDYLISRGATVADGIGRSILEIASLFCGFAIVFIIASVVYFSNGAFTQHPDLIYLVYIFWFFASTALAVFLVIQRPRDHNLISRLIDYFKKQENSDTGGKSKENGKIKNYWLLFVKELKTNMNADSLAGNSNPFVLAIISQAIVFFLDSLTLYALAFALNIQISFALVFIIFTFTQFISMISFVPGSLVIYEGGMVIMLIAFGVERGSALTLALLFRFLTFWLPMPIGWLLYRQHEKSHRKSQLVV